jgi:hypothetical protein
MDLTRKFEESASKHAIRISAFEINIKYLIFKAQYVHTKYGTTVLLSINPFNAELNPICHLLTLLGGATVLVFSRLRVKNKPYIIIKVFIHKQYSTFLSEDVNSINSQKGL